MTRLAWTAIAIAGFFVFGTALSGSYWAIAGAALLVCGGYFVGRTDGRSETREALKQGVRWIR